MPRITLSDKVIIVLSLCIIAGITFFAMYNNWWNLGLFWDLGIYQRAANDALAGLDPYREVDGMAFVYHPLFLHLFSTIQGIAPLHMVLAAGYILTIIWMVFEIRAYLKRVLTGGYSTLIHLVMPVLVSTTPFAIGVTTMVTGNMTTYFHFALFAYLLRTLRIKGGFTTVSTMVLIGVFTAVKPYFLAYMLLALLDKDGFGAKATRMFVALGIFLAIWATGFVFYPEQMQVFLHNVAGLQSSTRVDIGISFYRITYELGLSRLSGIAVHGILSVLLLLWVWRGIQRLKDNKNAQGFIVALAYFALTLVNPRMKEYDLWPAVMFAFVFWHAYRPAAKRVFVIFSVVLMVPILILFVTFFLGVEPGYVAIRG